ncbi:MAG: hypothetical protein ACKVHH_05750 [Candidatus Poseidoniales archaeon]|jgi:hypothetical protein
MHDTGVLVEVGNKVEYYSPTNERWLGNTVVSAVNGDGTYQIEVTKIVRRVENKSAVRNGDAPGNIRFAYTPSIGDGVEYHSPTNQRWLDGSVISAINGDGTFQIDVWKNTQSGLIVENKPAVIFGKAPGTIRKPPYHFAIGDAVEYHSPTNKRWLDRCTVTALNDDGSVAIDVVKRVRKVETKHAVVFGTSPGTIRSAAHVHVFSVGDKVDYNSPTNQYWLDGGVVRTVNDNGTYDIDLWVNTREGLVVQTKKSLRPGNNDREIRPHTASATAPGVIEELERQQSLAVAEAAAKREQIQHHASSTDSEIAALKAEMYKLQQEAEDARQAKLQMESEMASMRTSFTSPATSGIQDSAIGGDMHVGTTHNITTTNNDPEAIARAAIEAYRMAMEDKR